MSEIKFRKEQYDTKMGYLSMMNGRVELVTGSEVGKGSNISESIDSYFTMYEDIKNIVRYYKWALEDELVSLQNAGNVLYEADQTAKSLL